MKLLARVVVLAAVIGAAYLLFGEGPREVVLVYDLSASKGASRLEVELRSGGELVRRAEFRLSPDGGAVRHPLKVPDGDYVLAWRLTTPSGIRSGERSVVVSEPGTIVLALG